MIQQLDAAADWTRDRTEAANAACWEPDWCGIVMDFYWLLWKVLLSRCRICRCDALQTANHLATCVIFLKGLVGWKHLIIMEGNPNHIQIRYPRSLNAEEKQILNQRNLTDRSHTGPELSTSFDSRFIRRLHRFIRRLQGLLKEMIIWPAVWSWLVLLATSICWLSWSTFAWQQGLLLDGFPCKYYPETASAITPKRWVLIQLVPEEAKHSHSQQSNCCKPVMQETTQLAARSWAGFT